jgi:hypothetical protein
VGKLSKTSAEAGLASVTMLLTSQHSLVHFLLLSCQINNSHNSSFANSSSKCKVNNSSNSSSNNKSRNILINGRMLTVDRKSAGSELQRLEVWSLQKHFHRWLAAPLLLLLVR